MDKPKLNKSELTRLRRDIKMFDQFLPVLKLKKERLQSEQLRLKRKLVQQTQAFNATRKAASGLIALLAEPLTIDLIATVKPKRIKLLEKVIAGVRVPDLESIEFEPVRIPRFGMPAWVSRGIPRLHAFVEKNTQLKVLEEQYRRISHELRKASQKVNLFEKVLIPETNEAIRRIEIALGDQQVAAVCRGKIAKSKQLKAAQAINEAQSEALA